MLKNIIKIFIVLVLVLIPVLVFADTIYLIDGSVIKGEIIEITDDTVTIETKMGTLIVDKENIQKIEFDDLPEEEEIDPDEKLREEIRESLKDMVDEENIVIIIIKEEEKDIPENDTENDKDIPENDMNDNEIINNDKENNNQDVEFHNESDNNDNEGNITDWEYDYDNEDDYNWADNDDNNNDKDYTDDDEDYVGKSVFSLGFSSIGVLEDIAELYQFGISLRFLLDGWFGITGDINYGSTFTEWTSYSLGLIMLIPSWKFSPLVISAISYDQYYSYYYDDSYEGVTASIGGGFEWFMLDWLSVQWYVKKYYSLNTHYGSTRAIEDNFYTGIVLYLNF